MSRAIKHVNGFGEVRFQPEMYDGRRQYDTGWHGPNHRLVKARKAIPRPIAYAEPVLYRKAKKAARVAERQETWEAWQRKNEFKEEA